VSDRQRAEDSIEELLDDVRCLWTAQSPIRSIHGAEAVEELLYRWGYLADDHFETNYRSSVMDEIGEHRAVVTIALEARHRCYDLERRKLVLPDYE
jgi:hypothetical protein